jgi:hypothetical protein
VDIIDGDYNIPTQQVRLESLAINHQLTKFCFISLFALDFCLALNCSVQAQQPVSVPANRTNTDRQRQQEMTKREYQLRNFGVESKTPISDKEKKALIAQVEQDFNRILTLHNEIARAITSDAPLDYPFVSEASGEIKKRSARLRSTLMLQQSDEEKTSSSESSKFENDNFKPVLTTLCKHIRDFVTNPLIETPGTVSAEHLARAKRDLDRIISLSGRIHQRADQLSK